MPLKTQKSLLLPIMIQMDWRIFFSENDSTYPKDSVATTTVASTVPSCEYNVNTKKSRTDVVFLLSTTTYKKNKFCINSIILFAT